MEKQNGRGSLNLSGTRFAYRSGVHLFKSAFFSFQSTTVALRETEFTMISDVTFTSWFNDNIILLYPYLLYTTPSHTERISTSRYFDNTTNRTDKSIIVCYNYSI